MVAESLQTDVVVVGSGLGGLVSAVRAMENGAEVIVLEKGSRPGGTTIVSGGAFCARQDRDPRIAVHEPLEDGVEWLEDLGVTVSDVEQRWTPLVETINCTKRVDPPDFVDHMVDLIESGEGELRLETPMKELRTDGQHEITGVFAHDPDGGTIEIDASSVILATGGYAGNEQLVEQFLPSDTDIWLRRDPWSTGDGFLAATEIGAKTTRGLDEPYGHSLAGPPARIALDDLRDASQYYETTSIAITDDGTRFTDESRVAIGSHGFLKDLVQKAGGRAFLVIDHDTYESTWPHISVKSRVEHARDLGGPVIEADSLSELADGLKEYGVDGDRATETIQNFNQHITEGNTTDLEIPRTDRQIPMDTPPFFAIGVRAGVSFFFGGLDVNENAQVLARTNSTSTVPLSPAGPGEISIEPIEGLYAAGVEVGREDGHGHYTAGLALGLASGRIAGKHAAERATA